jgi:predicted dienelactone hydrolase
MRHALPLVFAFLLAPALRAAEVPSYKPDTGPHPVASLDTDWTDPARDNRTIPVRIYYPRDLDKTGQKFPVIVFSHGLGSGRGAYGLWSQHWASHGYIVIHPQHVGSDISIARNPSPTAFTDAINVQTGLDRVLDIHFVLDQAEKLNAGTLPPAPGASQATAAALAAMKNHLDLDHIGMAGHSFGAHTTLAVCGMTYTDSDGTRKNAGDPRIKAGIAMSPNQSFDTDQKTAFGSIKVPVLHMTGTEDTVFTIKPRDHRVPFDNASAEAYLITFTGANHITFTFPLAAGFVGSPPAPPPSPTARDAARSNTPRTGNAPRYTPGAGPTPTPAPSAMALPSGPANLTPATGDARAFTRLIRESSTAFWDATLKNDSKARQFLQHDLADALGRDGRLETRNLPASK